MSNKTSISDYDAYKQICKDASNDDSIFNTFKTNQTYRAILEHCSKQDGQNFINVIKENNNLDLLKIEKLKENDEQGNSIKEYYEEPFGLISPSTLRYIKVLSDLYRIFGSLDNFSIVEIGVGYGGQAKVIMDYFNIKEYSFIDLDEVLLLTEKYISKYKYENLSFYNKDNLPNKKYDLVISNYAFSELVPSIQDLYYEKIISNSNKGYMICNYIGPEFNMNLRNKEDMLSLMPGSKQEQEKPLTHPRNYVVYW